MSRWFRHYAGMMRDEKLVAAAVRAKQSVERVLWIWGAILESAAEINDNGKFALDTAEAAYFLRADETDLHDILSALEQLGRIAGQCVVSWGKRQFSSDRSAERTRNYRSKRQETEIDQVHRAVTVEQGDAAVTSQQRHRDAPETDTELETDSERKKDIRAVADATRPDEHFDKFLRSYPKRDGRNPKAPARKKFLAAVKSGADPLKIITGANRYRAECQAKQQIGTPYVAQMVTWLNQQSWDDYTPIAEVSATGPPSAGLPSDDELRAKYGAGNGRPDGISAEAGSGHGGRVADHSGDVFRSGAGDDRPDVPGERADNPTRNTGMRSVGEVFSRSPALATLGFSRNGGR